jgi:L-glutamine-phosphate cytidylyltransferase
MRAVILAAGAGSRLRPLTDARPKCMVELGGVPLLHRQLSVLASAGITDVTVVAGAHADAIVAPEAKVVLNPHWQSSNMVASLFQAVDVLRGGDDIVIGYGDIAYERRVLDALLATGGPLAVVVDRGWRPYWQARFERPLDDAETLRLLPDGTIAELGRRPRSIDEIEGQYIGLIKLSGESAADLVEHHDRLVRRDTDGAGQMYMTDFIQSLIDEGWPVKSAIVEHGWIEVDSPADVALYEAGDLQEFYCDEDVMRCL